MTRTYNPHSLRDRILKKKAEEADELRKTAASHRRHANFGCLSVEYAGWMVAADECDARAQEIENWVRENEG